MDTVVPSPDRVEADLTVRLFRKAVDHRQAQASALTDGLSGEKEIKRFSEHVSRHAHACI